MCDKKMLVFALRLLQMPPGSEIRREPPLERLAATAIKMHLSHLGAKMLNANKRKRDLEYIG
jgi:hypothetical protein